MQKLPAKVFVTADVDPADNSQILLAYGDTYEAAEKGKEIFVGEYHLVAVHKVSMLAKIEGPTPAEARAAMPRKKK